MLLIFLACSHPETVTLTATCTTATDPHDVTATLTLTGQPEAMPDAGSAQALLTDALSSHCTTEGAAEPVQAAVARAVGPDITASVQTTAVPNEEQQAVREALRIISYHEY